MMIFKKSVFNNFFIIFLLFIINLFVFYLSDLIMIWFFLEISTMLFISFVVFNNNNLKYEMINYFLIQSISSLFLLMLIFLVDFVSLELEFFYKNLFNLFMIMILLIKMGMVPFHSWYLFIMNKLDWISMMFLMTIQKIIPLIILEKFLMIDFINFLSVLLLLLLFNLLTNFSLKSIFSYSSIFHSYMFLITIYISYIFFLFYLIIYMFIMLFFSFFFNYFNMNKIVDFFNLNLNYMMKFMLIMGIFSLCMLPPIFSFYLKWLMMYFLMEMNYFFLIIYIMMYSLFLIFIYIRLMFLIFFNNNIYKIHVVDKLILSNYIMYFYMIMVYLYSFLNFIDMMNNLLS